MSKLKLKFFYTNGKTYTVNNVSSIDDDSFFDAYSDVRYWVDGNSSVGEVTSYSVSKDDLVAVTIVQTEGVHAESVFKYNESANVSISVSGFGH